MELRSLSHASVKFAAPDVVPAGVSASSVAAGIEPESMDVRGVMAIVLAVTAIVVAIVIAVFQMVNLEVQDVRRTVAASAGKTDLAAVELRAIEKLNNYSLIDQATSTYRIPIDRAIELIASETYQNAPDNPTEEVTLVRKRESRR